MKRRSFIILSALGLLGIAAIPFVQWSRNSGKRQPWAQPRFLSLLCDNRTIRMLGRAYLKLKPEETRGDILLKGLLDKKYTTVFTDKQEVSKVESQIEQRIRQDFNSRNTVVLKGWVLSVTEARQCAFFSILNR